MSIDSDKKLYGVFEDAEGSHGFTREDIASMSRDEEINMMLDWFHQYYEDPAERTPYESREGGYQWIWGGPYNATEELDTEFGSVVDFNAIEAAAAEIERDGFDWAPKPQPGDYDDYDPALATGEIVDGDDDWPPIVVSEKPGIDEPTARNVLLERLEKLETLIEPLATQTPSIGHNNPPSSINEQIISRDEWIEVLQSVREIREQASSSKPDIDQTAQRTTQLKTVAAKIGHWLSERATKGIDAAIKTASAATAGAVVINVTTNAENIYAAMESVIDAARTWISTLTQVF
jgi:hypothetical protein